MSLGVQQNCGLHAGSWRTAGGCNSLDNGRFA